MNTIKINVNFDDIYKISMNGITRSAVFMGIAINATKIDPPISHLPEGRFQTIFAPDASADQRREFLAEFETWAIACAMRDLIETFSVFLENIFTVSVIIRQNGDLTREQVSKKRGEFERKGASDQLLQLSELVGLNSSFISIIRSLTVARNCLSHRRGVVSERDVDPNDGKFTLRWRRQEYSLREPDGVERRIELDIPDAEPISVNKGTEILVRMADASKSFEVGEVIVLNQRDLYEICLSVYAATGEVHEGCISYARSHGHNL